MDKISIKGARTHNLKNISLDIPRGELVVITGLIGLGQILPSISIRSMQKGKEGMWNHCRLMQDNFFL